ncbi:MAG: hypothetical protein GF317_07175 [Candidatus Lokiarchaeota archaeon]|nr:hypothetical protein [Candidatus Lokiarchaeota archaeon]MBD3199490.1 hypothetical protein [Candidatus Lokiarchaeota archaeon]
MVIELTFPQILQGTFNLIFVIISFIVGLTILTKYFKFKRTHYISIGIIWIGISTPWLHGAIAFILLLFNIEMLQSIRFIIAYAVIPIITALWFNTFTDFIYEDKKKLFVSLISIIAGICEMIFFIFLFTDQEGLVGVFDYANGEYFTATYRPFTRFTLLFFLASAFISFMLFASQSLKSADPEVKLKGKFLIIAFITYTICAVIDSFAFFLQFEIIVVIIRVLLMLSAIEFYLGWILPEFVKNHLIK